jgi:pSer/pThr/pTyr-binding forkhead associated (FHA) protein
VSFLKNLESKLEKLIEGGFKTAFKSEVQPIELARKLAREMDSHRAASVSRTYAPNEFIIYLSPADREQFSHYEEGLTRELSLYLLEHARKRGYSLISRPTVTIETEDRLELGTFGIQARLADAPAEAAPQPAAQAGHTMVYNARDIEAPPAGLRPSPAAAPRAVIEFGDRRYALAPPATVVGRGSESDVKLDDPNVSRRHARFSCDGGEWRVEDLGSTNGTLLRGAPVAGAAALRSGDRVTLGNCELTFILE